MDEQQLITRFQLEPMPLEGGMFRRVWLSDEAGPGSRRAGSAIIVLLSKAHGSFSAMHRLPVDEVWHFYLGDPLEQLLLYPDGSSRVRLMGPDLAAGHEVVCNVPAGTWMGARVAAEGRWSLFGCTMAPGFIPSDYEGATAADLVSRYPDRADLITSLVRPGMPLRH